MAGHVNGLYGNFKKLIPSLIFTHCVSHKTNLVLKDICENIHLVCLINSLTHSIVNTFSNSSNKVKILTNDTDNVDNLNIVNFSETRWTSNFSAMTRIFDIFQPLITTLTEISKNSINAVGIVVKLKEINFLLCYAAYLDILAIFYHLFNVFQRRCLFICEVNNEVLSSIKTLDKLYFGEPKNFYGYWYSNILEAYLKDGAWKNITLDGHLKRDEVNSFVENLVGQARQSLSARFVIEEVSQYLSCFNFAEMKKQKGTCLIEYGKDNLRKLVNYLNIEVKVKPLLNFDLICGEYQRLKFAVTSSLDSKEALEIYEYFFINCESYVEILSILEFSATIALTSMEFERVFSKMKLIKTSLRNQMKEDVLDSHLNISLNIHLFHERKDELIERSIQFWKSISTRYFTTKK
jgi:hypothetical protein